MKQEIRDLIEISQFYGKNKEYTLAGGGNTSYKDDKTIWVKASGAALATIDENGFAVLDREKVKKVGSNKYSDDVQLREKQVKEDLINSAVDPEDKRRPSVETSFHELINYKFVVHMHPFIVNALMCSNKAEEMTRKLFGEEVLYIGFAPGYDLFKEVERQMIQFREKYKKDAKLIFLENHGVFVSADNIDEIKQLYDHVTNTIKNNLTQKLDIKPLPVDNNISEIMPAVRMMLSDENTKVARIRNHTLAQHFAQDKKHFDKVALPFTPDIIVYCKSKYLYIDQTGSPEQILKALSSALEKFKKQYGFPPKIMLIKGYGIIGIEENAVAAETAIDVFEDLMKISFLSENFGGPHFMNEKEIEFIDNWEVENYRRKIAAASAKQGKANNKIAIITGAAQGFGAGIAEQMFAEGANVVIADLQEETGEAMAAKLNEQKNKNRALFVKTDVSSAESVSQTVCETVKAFGGLDLLVSNAGVLKAGGLDTIEPDTFDFMTNVNYKGYFICAKYASEVMKIQHQYAPDYFMDIIQINSKSGLKGSNKNFTYAGSKFGGVGLTQSFAMELMPFNIKVNAICPGNFFDGPLWSDPEKGLFVQYLKAGKVKGAKTIEDVKKYYEEQVPAKRGCMVKDVMRAIYYAIEQEYETGQAIPVTGGQVMLK